MPSLMTAVLLVLVAVPKGDAPVVPAAPPAVSELRHSWPLDGTATGVTAVLWLASDTVLKSQFAPAQCRLWCEPAPVDTSARNAIVWAPGDRKLASRLSDIDVYAVLPLTVIGLDWYMASSNGNAGGAWSDLLLITETVAFSSVVNQAVKFTVGRQRPYAHFGTPGTTYEVTNDDNLSFYSGHSNFAFTLVVAAGTVAQLRGYKNAWMIWAVGLPLAAVAPYLRMAGDKHYLTDVVVGSLAGAAFGIGVPLLHGRQSQANVAILPAPNGAAIVGVF